MANRTTPSRGGRAGPDAMPRMRLCRGRRGSPADGGDRLQTLGIIAGLAQASLKDSSREGADHMSNKRRPGRVAGPLAPYAAGFIKMLAGEGYAAGSIRNHLVRMAQLSRWLDAERLDADALSGEVVERFLASRRAAGYRSWLSLRAFSPLLGHLRGLGVAPSDPVPVAATPLEVLMGRYATFLIEERGLQPNSAVDYVRAAKAFLGCRPSHGGLDLGDLSGSEVIDYVRRQCAGGTVGHARRRTRTAAAHAAARSY